MTLGARSCNIKDCQSSTEDGFGGRVKFGALSHRGLSSRKAYKMGKLSGVNSI